MDTRVVYIYIQVVITSHEQRIYTCKIERGQHAQECYFSHFTGHWILHHVDSFLQSILDFFWDIINALG